MEYYKIIYENTIVGAVDSSRFIRYSTVNHCLLYCSKTQGQYIIYNEKLYRDSWMKPLSSTTAFIEAQVLEITKEEYDVLIQALQVEEEIKVEEPEEDEESLDYLPIEDTTTIDFVRSSKIKEMSSTCRKAIENGFDLMLSDGKTHHFSLSAQDQMNLLVISTTLDTQEKVSYHADGELSKFYSAAEMKQIIDAANAHKEYHTTYYNALKAYINSLNTMEAIAAITYGTSIPDKFQSEVWKVLNK